MKNDYDLISHRQPVEMVHLKGIGRFCKCGCNRRITEKTIKRLVNGRLILQTMLRKDQIFFSPACKARYYLHTKGKTNNSSLWCKVFLSVNDAKEPYREIRIYLKKGIIKKFRITQEQKELWEFLENISRYRYMSPKKEIIIKQNEEMMTQ